MIRLLFQLIRKKELEPSERRRIDNFSDNLLAVLYTTIVLFSLLFLIHYSGCFSAKVTHESMP